MENFNRVVVVAPTRSTCLNISMVLSNGAIPETLLMQEKKEEIFEAIGNLEFGGFGVVAGTGTGKTVAIRDIAKKVLETKSLSVDVVTREHEATERTWRCNTLVVTPGVALNWFKSGILSKKDLLVFDEIHQTSDHLELTMALAKRVDCKFIWMSATIDASVYSNYLDATGVIECSAFDPAKRSEVETSSVGIEDFLSSKVEDFVSEKRAVAVFVPTRAMAENLSRRFNETAGLYCDFYHGGEKAEKLRQFLKGDVPKPFMVFMTIAGASSLNILGLDTVVIVDSMYKEVIHSGVPVLEKVQLGNNELLQMGGRVNGRTENSEVHILTGRYIKFHDLKPTVPEFVLGGDLQRVALTCAKLGINAGDLDLIAPINQAVYNREVKRFRDRGVIEMDGDALTVYGKKIERLPVDSAQAEMLVSAQKTGDCQLLNTVIVTSCVDQLFGLLRRDAQLFDVNVSGSDHLTSYNIIVSALVQFGFVAKSKNNSGGLEYGFRGNWFKKRYNKQTKRTESQKGEFTAWCDEIGFNGKGIKEVTLAMKSVYRQLEVELPSPEDFPLIESGDFLYESFLNLLAKVQSFDFVLDEYNSKAGQVWASNHSRTSGNRVLGKIRHWTDKRGYQRATVEGTEVPKDLMELYARKTPHCIYDISDEGVKVEFKTTYAGESVDSVYEIVSDAELPVELIEEAEEKFVDSFLAKRFSGVDVIVDQNRKIRRQSENLRDRSDGEVEAISESDEKVLYRAEFEGKGIVSVQACMQAIQDGQVNPQNLVLKLEDFISTEEQEIVKEYNPDTIKVLGEDFPVSYSNGYAPKIKLEGDLVKQNRWMDLPDSGIKLPGGKDVKVEVIIGSDDSYYDSSYTDTDIPALKEKVRNHFNQKVWENWEKPEIAIPDVAVEDITIPEIETREYGKCVVTEAPLVAYGTIIAYQYWSNDPVTWKYEWYREQKMVEEKREKAIEALALYQAMERKKRLLEAIVIPDPSQEDAAIPEIVEIESGYGVVIVDSSHYYGDKSWFKIHWTENREDAERCRELVVKKLIEIKTEEIGKRELSEAKAEANVVKNKVQQVYFYQDKDKLDSILRDKLYKFYYDYVPSDLDEIRQWTADAQNACNEAEEGFAKIERKRAERREMGIEIPDSLISIYNGDEDKAYTFMQKVVALKTNDLDEHVVCACGRDRVRHHLIEVSGDEDFFLGADPNDVKYYVGDVHYYSGKDEFEALQILSDEEDQEEVIETGDGIFEDVGKREFKCSCKKFSKISKGEWKKYQDGMAIEICCSVCGARGEVQKEIEIIEPKPVVPKKKADLNFSDLLNKF